MVVSAGTRNHFALDLGLDRDDPSKCLDALTGGVELCIDLGVINDRVFVNNASFGAYASVVQSAAYRDDKVRTTLRMLPDLLAHRDGPRLSVRAEGVTVEQPQAVLVSNNPYRTDDPAGLGHREQLDSGVLGVLGVKVDSAAQAAGVLRGPRAPGDRAADRSGGRHRGRCRRDSGRRGRRGPQPAGPGPVPDPPGRSARAGPP
nr:hypothetical protein [Streptomyces sp. AS13]